MLRETRTYNIFSDLPQPMETQSFPRDKNPGNLAIASGDCLNLILHLGDHGLAIDVRLLKDIERSYVTLRYFGGSESLSGFNHGFFIQQVLAVLDFGVSRKANVVLGRLKRATSYDLPAVVRTLGSMTAFLACCHMSMKPEEDPRTLFKRFSVMLPPSSWDLGDWEETYKGGI
jgi:hypothetical protein